MSARDRYIELVAKVDEFFAGVQARYGDVMQCAAGCSDCCHSRFSVTLVEAAYIAEGFSGDAGLWPEGLGDGDVCAALGPGGRCRIYARRPLICRSHGLPLRRAGDGGSADGRVHLPVVEACAKNFGGGVLESVEPRMVLDQGTLATVLGAVDAAFADECGVPRGMRVELAELLAHPEQYFEVPGCGS